MTRLTAEQLEITQAELDALIWVRDALDPTIPDHTLPAWMQFDMSNWGSIDTSERLAPCGTACCIGGSMEMHMAGLTAKLQVGDHVEWDDIRGWDDKLNDLTGRPSGSQTLWPLFYNYPSDHEDRTREKAVEAIDRFLAGSVVNPWLA